MTSAYKTTTPPRTRAPMRRPPPPSNMHEVPFFTDVMPSKRASLLLAKFALCSQIFDFTDPNAMLGAKEAKRRHLVDLLDYLSSNMSVLTAPLCAPFIAMVSANIFRSLPVRSGVDAPVEAPEDDELFCDPAWPHLSVVYELLLRFVVSPDPHPGAARAALTERFVTALVDLFNSEDVRERAVLTTVLHRVYGRLMALRAPIRRALLHVFHRVAYASERCHGLPELLEILGSIINGFALPLKDEHKGLLRNGLLPLHLPDALPAYHVQLAFCVAQFVEKDAALGADVVACLLRHWPACNSRKEVMLLSELEEVLELVAQDDLARVVIPLFRRLGRSIASAHFQVAERALFFWNNEYIVDEVFMAHRHALMPAVIGPLLKNTRSHWNPNVLSLSCHVLGHLEDMDGRLFYRCKNKHEADVRDESRRSEERRSRWHAVYQLAAKKSSVRQRQAAAAGGMEQITRQEEGGNNKVSASKVLATALATSCVGEMVKDATSVRISEQV